MNEQLDNGVIPSNKDGSFDPWDFIESITALNFLRSGIESKKAFRWLKDNQNSDGSWYSKYSSEGEPVEKINLPISLHIFQSAYYITIKFF